MVYKIFVEKKSEFAHEANALYPMPLIFRHKNLSAVRVINRYFAENIDKDLFDYAVKTVFRTSG